MDRERLRMLVKEGDIPAARELATRQLRSPIPEDYALIQQSPWFQLGTGSRTDFGVWQQFAEVLLKHPDADDYKSLDEAGRNHLMVPGAVDIMDNALAKIRKLISYPEPFSLRNNPKFNRRRR